MPSRTFYPLTMPFAPTPLGRLFLQHFGHGPPVTFWHCLFGDSSIFLPVLDAVSRDHHVVLVDGPSHGRSDPWPRPLTVDQCADAWVEALDHQGVTEPAVFGGLSWGSMVAMRVALRHPHRVKALVLMSTMARATPRRLIPQFAALSLAIRAVGFPHWLVDQVARSMVSPATRTRHPELARDLLRRNRALDRRGLFHASWSLLVRRRDMSSEIARIVVPTWVIAGTQDRVTPLGAGKHVARTIPGARLEVLEGVGHVPTMEAPDRVKEILRQVCEAV